MKIFLVRHGQTEENLSQILQGHMPGTLTELGKKQVNQTAEKLIQLPNTYQYIVSSDLKRALDSATIIQQLINLPIIATNLLRERNWGSYTGISVHEAKEKYYHDKTWDFPITDYPVESEAQLEKRAHQALEFLSANYEDYDIIVVTHGLFARFLIAACQGVSFKETTPLENAEIRILTI